MRKKHAVISSYRSPSDSTCGAVLCTRFATERWRTWIASWKKCGR